VQVLFPNFSPRSTVCALYLVSWLLRRTLSRMPILGLRKNKFDAESCTQPLTLCVKTSVGLTVVFCNCYRNLENTFKKDPANYFVGCVAGEITSLWKLLSWKPSRCIVNKEVNFGCKHEINCLLVDTGRRTEQASSYLPKFAKYVLIKFFPQNTKKLLRFWKQHSMSRKIQTTYFFRNDPERNGRIVNCYAKPAVIPANNTRVIPVGNVTLIQKCFCNVTCLYSACTFVEIRPRLCSNLYAVMKYDKYIICRYKNVFLSNFA